MLKTFKLPYDNPDLVSKFSIIITPILKQISNLDIENKQLTQLRDWLLSMLMNGQVTVK